LLYQLELLKRADVRDVILSLSYQPQKIEDKLGDGTDYNVRVSYVVEASPLGTAGAYRNAASLISETTVVFNGDVLTDIDMNEVIRFHRERQAAATIVLAPVPNPTAYGLVETEKDGRVRRFLEKPKPEEVTCDTINAGIYILEPRVLDYVPEGEPFMFEYGVFPGLLERKEPFFAYIWRGYWRDIGTASSYLQANLDVIAGRVKRHTGLALIDAFQSTVESDNRKFAITTGRVNDAALLYQQILSDGAMRTVPMVDSTTGAPAQAASKTRIAMRCSWNPSAIVYGRGFVFNFGCIPKTPLRYGRGSDWSGARG